MAIELEHGARVLLNVEPLVGFSAMRLLFGVSFLIVSHILAVAILITLTVATGIAAGATSRGAQVGDAIENHPEYLSAGAVH